MKKTKKPAKIDKRTKQCLALLREFSAKAEALGCKTFIAVLEPKAYKSLAIMTGTAVKLQKILRDTDEAITKDVYTKTLSALKKGG